MRNSRILALHKMDLFPVDDAGLLYVSPEIIDWRPLVDQKIRLVIDLEETIDADVPTLPNNLIYVYFPFADADLPDLVKLHSLGKLVAEMVRSRRASLIHCSMGLNRSPLMAGIALTYLGMNGPEALKLLREKREGALYNPVFASYLASLSAHPELPPD